MIGPHKRFIIACYKQVDKGNNFAKIESITKRVYLFYVQYKYGEMGEVFRY